MLSNAYFLAKFRFDTAENEPAKNLQNFANSRERFSEILRVHRMAVRLLLYELGRRVQRLGHRRHNPIGKISAKCCSFSAVSAPIFASKYAFVSIFQNLPDFQAEIFEIWQNFATFANFCRIFTKISDFSNRFFAKILRLQRCKSMQIL